MGKRKDREASASEDSGEDSPDNKENLEAKLKRVERLQKQIKKLKQKEKKRTKASSLLPPSDDEDGFESEEEAAPRPFSSSVQPLTPISVPNGSARKVELRRVGAAAPPRPAPRLSSTAFKNLTSQSSDDISGPGSSPTPSARVHVPALTVSAATQITAASIATAPVAATSAAATFAATPQAVPTTLAPTPVVAAGQAASALPTADDAPKVPQLRTGANHNPKKPKAGDFEDTVNALVIRAAFEYEALVSTSDFFPDTVLRNRWAHSSWRSAGEAAGLKYEIISAISLLLRKRGTRIRGHALTKIRTCLMLIFGFENKANPATKMKNEMLYQKLKKDSSFHYKDIEGRKGFAEGKIVSECLKAVWFEDKNSQGVFFATLFNPIPVETIASILTVIDFCLDEWATGVQVKATMWEKDVLARHKVFREDVNKWCAMNKNVTTSIRSKMYKRARRDAGALDDAVVVSTLDKNMLDQMKDELEGRTGETDSEAEE